MIRLLLLALGVLLVTACSPSSAPEPVIGAWTASLDSPGGDLTFGLDLVRDAAGAWSASLVNGEERIDVPRVEVGDGRLVLGMDHYDSTITADVGAGGRTLSGAWRKRRGADAWTEMAFAAEPGDPFDGLGDPTQAPGRYRIEFESDEQPAVGEFALHAGGQARGTFLTTTGDYRFLAGRWTSGPGDSGETEVTLSCFDGAHAFLFRHVIDDQLDLSGDFWSRDAWHETYRGTPDLDFALPDGFALTRSEPDVPLASLRFPDLDGVVRGLDDPAFAGRARILQLFGSWCPNCTDASKLMAELEATYAERGLSIVGLAFELTGDAARDAEQVRRYAERSGVGYPLLVAGLADKAQASEVFPLLDRVRSYPTTVFLHGDGRVRAVYQGFSGPATGRAHDDLRAAFIGLVEELLAE